MQRPSVAEVRAELRQVSERVGLNYSTAKMLPITAQLPAVEASMRHNNRHPDDREAVVFEYVACVARSVHLLGEHYSALLCVALNIEPVSDLGLGARISGFCEDNFIAQNTYDKRRDNAYTVLAGHLVALDHSPCDTDADQEQEETARIEVAFRTKYAEDTLAMLKHVWERVCFLHSDPERQNEEFRRMIETLPGAAAHIRSNEDSPYELVQSMVRRVLQTEYPKWLKVLNLEGEYLPAESLLSALEVIGEFDGDVSRMVQRVFDEIEVVETPLTGDEIDNVRGLGGTPTSPSPGGHSYSAKNNFAEMHPRTARRIQDSLDRSFGFALQILLTIEEAGGWRWIPKPDTVRHAEGRPFSYI